MRGANASNEGVRVGESFASCSGASRASWQRCFEAGHRHSFSRPIRGGRKGCQREEVLFTHGVVVFAFPSRIQPSTLHCAAKLTFPVLCSFQAEAEVKVEPRPAAVSGKAGPRVFEDIRSASSWGGSPGGALRAEAAKASGRGPGYGFRCPRLKEGKGCGGLHAAKIRRDMVSGSLCLRAVQMKEP